jgi:V8-like Glu-specific endopeptidase
VPVGRATGDLLIKLVTAAAVVTTAVVGAGFMILTATAAGAPTLTATPGHAPTVGALFNVSSTGALGSHFCTASVVDSPAGDLILTAAHCMTARSAGDVAFVPDYANGRMPYGVWMITRVFVDQAWSSSADPDDDFAFLVVSQRGSDASIQQFTGGEAVATGTPAGQRVTTAGYPDGAGTMVSCVNTVLAYSPTQFVFDCGGFADGTSGGPMLAGFIGPGSPGTVIGVIGGFEQGGDTPSVSYAARFSTDMAALYKTAVAAAGL